MVGVVKVLIEALSGPALRFSPPVYVSCHGDDVLL